MSALTLPRKDPLVFGVYPRRYLKLKRASFNRALFVLLQGGAGMREKDRQPLSAFARSLINISFWKLILRSIIPDDFLSIGLLIRSYPMV